MYIILIINTCIFFPSRDSISRPASIFVENILKILSLFQQLRPFLGLFFFPVGPGLSWDPRDLVVAKCDLETHSCLNSNSFCVWPLTKWVISYLLVILCLLNSLIFKILFKNSVTLSTRTIKNSFSAFLEWMEPLSKILGYLVLAHVKKN